MSNPQKRKGVAFESLIRDYLRAHGHDVARTIAGAENDEGDLHGLRIRGNAIAIECKNHQKMALAQWVEEAKREAENAHAALGIVVHKRRGKGAAGEQYVTLRLEDLMTLLDMIGDGNGN